MGTSVILSYGMGVDSTAILLRWLEEPETRGFELSDLTVITAMVGNEFPSTGALVERHILPRLAAAGVRFVQVARAGASEKDGYVVLSDSTAPEKLFLGGAFKLTDELLPAGTIPQYASGKRLCSIKMKGVPLDAWIANEMAGREYRHVIGFNAEEMKRVERDCSYATVQRHSEYPLVEWNWGREKCETYIAELVGEPWKKSCCTFCPFASGREGAMARFAEEPGCAAEALKVEVVALSLNPRSTLYPGGKSLESCLRKAGQLAPIAAVESWKAGTTWALYRVRRAFRAKGQANRSVEIVAEGSREEMNGLLLRTAAAPVVEEAGFKRAYTIPLAGGFFPAPEEMLVAAPKVAGNKAVKGFEKRWAAAVANAAAQEVAKAA